MLANTCHSLSTPRFFLSLSRNTNRLCFSLDDSAIFSLDETNLSVDSTMMAEWSIAADGASCLSISPKAPWWIGVDVSSCLSVSSTPRRWLRDDDLSWSLSISLTPPGRNLRWYLLVSLSLLDESAMNLLYEIKKKGKETDGYVSVFVFVSV